MNTSTGGLQITDNIDTQVPLPLINESAIHDYFRNGNNAEKIPSCIAFAKKLLPFLPPGEREAFAADPIRFISKQYLFRGLTVDKYNQLLADGYFKPQGGQMNSIAVFLSDSPFGAAGYGGFVAMFDRSRLIHRDASGFVAPGTADYKSRCDAYLSQFTPEKRREAVWDVDNEFDMVSRPMDSTSPGESIYALRNPQPLSSVAALFVPNGDDFTTVTP